MQKPINATYHSVKCYGCTQQSAYLHIPDPTRKTHLTTDQFVNSILHYNPLQFACMHGWTDQLARHDQL